MRDSTPRDAFDVVVSHPGYRLTSMKAVLLSIESTLSLTPWHESLSVQNAIELIVKAKLIRKWRKPGKFVALR